MSTFYLLNIDTNRAFARQFQGVYSEGNLKQKITCSKRFDRNKKWGGKKEEGGQRAKVSRIGMRGKTRTHFILCVDERDQNSV